MLVDNNNFFNIYTCLFRVYKTINLYYNLQTPILYSYIIMKHDEDVASLQYINSPVVVSRQPSALSISRPHIKVTCPVVVVAVLPVRLPLAPLAGAPPLLAVVPVPLSLNLTNEHPAQTDAQ